MFLCIVQIVLAEQICNLKVKFADPVCYMQIRLASFYLQQVKHPIHRGIQEFDSHLQDLRAD
jgi:hypothetical protein